VGEAIPLLNSANPMDRKKAMEILNAYQNASARDLAFYMICAVVEKEIIPDIKIQMLSYLSQTAKNNPDKVNEIFEKECNNPNEAIKGTAMMLLDTVKNPSVIPQVASPIIAPAKQVVEVRPEPEPVKIEPPPPKPKKNERPKFPADSIENQLMEQLKVYGSSQSGMMKKTIEMGLSFASKQGMVGPYLDVLTDVPNWGTDMEIISACELMGIIGKYNPGGATSLGSCLKHSNPYVREKAAAALVTMGKNAAPAQAELMEATKDLSLLPLIPLAQERHSCP